MYIEFEAGRVSRLRMSTLLPTALSCVAYCLDPTSPSFVLFFLKGGRVALNSFFPHPITACREEQLRTRTFDDESRCLPRPVSRAPSATFFRAHFSFHFQRVYARVAISGFFFVGCQVTLSFTGFSAAVFWVIWTEPYFSFLFPECHAGSFSESRRPVTLPGRARDTVLARVLCAADPRISCSSPVLPSTACYSRLPLTGVFTCHRRRSPFLPFRSRLLLGQQPVPVSVKCS